MNINNIALNFLKLINPETAHNITIKMLKNGIYFKPLYKDDEILKTELWGKKFPNPVGLSAGFDKNGECYNAMLDLGMGFCEIGSVTPLPQEGNPKPRLFRLPKDGAVINRLGFNNLGIDYVFKQLQKPRRGILGVNLGKNKTTADPVIDFVKGCKKLSTLADYLVINVSSPNTPGLRKLQGQKELTDILSNVQKTINKECGENSPPLLVKIAPDLNEQGLNDIAQVAKKLKIDGIIISNTTLKRPNNLHHKNTLDEIGGLSGKPLFKKSTQMLAKMYKLTDGEIPLIGVGGISSGEEAYEKICNGASLIQLYSALVYGGAGLITDIKKDLAKILKQNGFESISQAVGIKVK
ncbi:quinone-dependent dihydroorotate dehydrogenase [Alphaproteobacteria bacterium]|nr:quinone-dependent dihydroorotate dehydrogenase [Alphaproteobacteria bacterium]